MCLNQRLAQKVALITSSSSGICASTAKQLASEGAKVMICGRNGAKGMATVRHIRSQGGRASFTLADTAIPADAQAVIDETIATYGRLDILFNNANSSHAQDGAVLNVSEAAWDRVSEAVLKGTFFCCQYALPFLQQSGSGTIINLIEQSHESEMRSVNVICQGGIVALTKALAQQSRALTTTANLIWATQHPADSPSMMSLLTPPLWSLPGAAESPTSVTTADAPYAPMNRLWPVEQRPVEQRPVEQRPVEQRQCLLFQRLLKR
ncbi:MAG: SDR family NAD(P)-dependent oxidoreductase [Phormidesmis sp. RL_2_1]|nr:SDR family NAD(P)-dependent oxidoreductase [Phormidesmis sp. RL_2_1]